jgi:NifU-like protein involved in Fe-S cluster formation
VNLALLPKNGKVFSPQVWDHFKNPRGRKPLPSFNGEGWAGNTAIGQFMRIQLNVVDGVVTEAGYETFGCLAAIAAGSYVVQWVTGKSLAEALLMDPGRLNQELGSLPRDRFFCAEMAVHGLHQALKDASEREKRNA